MEERTFDLVTERLGPLPLVNHFSGRLVLLDILDRLVPTADYRCVLSCDKRPGVLLRSIITERESIYRLGEVVATFDPEGSGLIRDEAERVTDDMVGGALDRLFDADRGSLLTDILVAAQSEFSLSFDELHNDSTTIKFTASMHGPREGACGGRKRPS